MSIDQSYVIDTRRSRYARLTPIPVGSVRLRPGFWEPRVRRTIESTLPSQHALCEETGRLNNFRRLTGEHEGPFAGRYYNDSDVYKWMEAAAYGATTEHGRAAAELMEQVGGLLVCAQQADGYLHSYFALERAADRWSNLRDMHELYCMGHFIQAALACHRVTGDVPILEAAVRLGDLLVTEFGPTGRVGACGHQQIEMAMVDLYRQTGDARYLDLAGRFLDARGRKPSVLGGRAYLQDHRPFRKLTTVTGHAVRMMYYCCGAADLYLETGETALWRRLNILWRAMTERKMYVTGGVGSRYEGEAFGDDFELPNGRAYAESCAAIGAFMWSFRMLLASPEAKFAAHMERCLYNGILVGLSEDGERYFYQNPLADDGTHRRQPWFDCACCPPNLSRLLAALPGYFYGTDSGGLWIHQYAASDVDVNLDVGRVRFTVHTDYPWSGRIRVEFHESPMSPWTLHLRIPDWIGSEPFTVAFNGNSLATEPSANGYLDLWRNWTPHDELTLDFPMPVRLHQTGHDVEANWFRVALSRGPLIYCAEACDLGGTDPRAVSLIRGRALTTTWDPDLLGGVVWIGGEGELHLKVGDDVENACLIDPFDDPRSPLPIRMIPYYAWANRNPGAMAVWLLDICET